MNDELLPCPFCGESNAIICETDYEGNTELVPAYAVSCRTKRCAAGIWSLAMGHFDTRKKAIKAWNTRSDSKGMEKENYNLRLTLQAIADDTETQTSGSFGMRRLSGYASDCLKGIDWVDEFADSKPYKWETSAEWVKAEIKNPVSGIGIDSAFNAARERKE